MCLVGNVATDGGTANLVRELLQTFRAAGSDDEARAFLGEALRTRPTDTARCGGAGDDYGLVPNVHGETIKPVS